MAGKVPKKLNVYKVTRLCVIDDSTLKQGRVLDMWEIKLEFCVQDGGKTLKIFLTDKEPV
jgi:hypothetical protein